MNRTTTEEERLRKLGQVRVGIAPQGLPGVPGQPSRPAPAVGIAPVAPAAVPPLRPAAGIAAVPKYGSMDYVRADGSRRVVAGGQPEYNLVEGVQVPTSTPMRQTPNFDANVPDTPAPGVAPLAPVAGQQIRRDPASGGAVQMPAEAWARYDAAGAARRGGIAPVASGQPAAGAVQPAVGIAPPVAPAGAVQPAVGIAPQAAPVAPVAAPAAPAAGGLFPDRAAERQRQHDLAMDRSRFGLQRGGATSAAGREFDAARAAESDAARRTTLVQGQQAIQREGQQLAAQSVRDKAAMEGAAGLMGKQIEGQTARDVAATDTAGKKYVADKGAETALTMAEREDAARRETRLQDAALKREELALRYRQQPDAVDPQEINDLVKDDGKAILAYRAAVQKQYDPDPRKNEEARRKALDALAVQFYGKGADAAYLERLDAGLGWAVDMQQQRFRGGARGGGAAAGRASAAAGRPGSKWETQD